eukprot:g41495.t1
MAQKDMQSKWLQSWRERCLSTSSQRIFTISMGSHQSSEEEPRDRAECAPPLCGNDVSDNKNPVVPLPKGFFEGKGYDDTEAPADDLRAYDFQTVKAKSTAPELKTSPTEPEESQLVVGTPKGSPEAPPSPITSLAMLTSHGPFRLWLERLLFQGVPVIRYSAHHGQPYSRNMWLRLDHDLAPSVEELGSMAVERTLGLELRFSRPEQPQPTEKKRIYLLKEVVRLDRRQGSPALERPEASHANRDRILSALFDSAAHDKWLDLQLSTTEEAASFTTFLACLVALCRRALEQQEEERLQRPVSPVSAPPSTPTALVETRAIKTAEEALTVQEAGRYWTEVVLVLSQTYLFFFSFWSCAYGFHVASYWEYLYQPAAVSSVAYTLLCVAWLGLPGLLLEVRPLAAALAPLFWFFQGVVPACLVMATALHRGRTVRLVLLGVAAGCGALGQAGVLCLPASHKLVMCWPVAANLAILVWTASRIATGGAMWNMDAGYEPSAVAGAVLALLVSPIVRAAAWDIRPIAWSERACGGRNSLAWLPTGVIWGECITITLAVFSNASSLAVWSNAWKAQAVMLVITPLFIGFLLMLVLARMHDLVTLLTVVLLVPALGLLAGGIGTKMAAAGGIVLGLSWASVLLFAFQESALLARGGALGRVLVLGAGVLFVNIAAFLAAFQKEGWAAPAFAAQPVYWLLLVFLPLIASILLLGLTDIYQHRSNKQKAQLSSPAPLAALAHSPTPQVELRLWAPVRRGVPVAISWVICCFLNAGLLVWLGSKPIPVLGINRLKVLTYFTQQGFDSTGYFNGHCLLDLVHNTHTDVALLTDTDTMTLMTVNRDISEYLMRNSDFNVDHGDVWAHQGVTISRFPWLEFNGTYPLGLSVRLIDVNQQPVLLANLQLPSPDLLWSYLSVFNEETRPIIVGGFFGIEPNHGDARPWDVAVALNFSSVTPFDCESGPPAGVPSSQRCSSAFPTVLTQGEVQLQGLQWDWLLYRGEELTLLSSSVQTLPHALSRQDAIYSLGPDMSPAYCSSHAALSATFLVQDYIPPVVASPYASPVSASSSPSLFSASPSPSLVSGSASPSPSP